MLLTNILPLIAIKTDALTWGVGILVIAAASAALWIQRRNYRRLRKELDTLDSMGKRNVSFDMVSKTMKLATWRIDIATQEVTFDCDYREYPDYVSSKDMYMQDFITRIAPEDQERIRQAMQELFDGRKDENSARYRVRPYSTERYMWEESFCMVAERNEAGQPTAVVGASTCIEKQKKIEEELIEARNKAEESERLKSAFLANISHEIRTPLNAIVGFSDILPMVNEKEERDQLISLIQENNHKLLRMIDDLVNFSKIEAGVKPAEMEDFNLISLLKDVVGNSQQQYGKPGIEIRLMQSNETMMLHSDRKRVETILDHYMQNALKFTDKGSVTLGYDLLPKEDKIRIWVQDTGKGIPADKCSQIFEQFVKLDDFIPGTGLGLPICRLMARSINGSVGVDSQDGVGSKFWVKLPL